MTTAAPCPEIDWHDYRAPRRLEVHPTGGLPFIIRAYEPGDGELKRQSANSFEHLRPWMSWIRSDETETESEQLTLLFYEQYIRGKDFLMLITSLDGHQLLGGTGFHLREGDLSSQCAEVGLWVAEDFAGRGFGTRVLRSMLQWGFSDWPFLRLSWRCDSRNLASRRVAEKAGMLQEGILRSQKAEVGNGRRDTYCYAALKEEWEEPAPHSYG